LASDRRERSQFWRSRHQVCYPPIDLLLHRKWRRYLVLAGSMAWRGGCALQDEYPTVSAISLEPTLLVDTAAHRDKEHLNG
jgi:hypothetical protein